MAVWPRLRLDQENFDGQCFMLFYKITLRVMWVMLHARLYCYNKQQMPHALSVCVSVSLYLSLSVWLSLSISLSLSLCLSLFLVHQHALSLMCVYCTHIHTYTVFQKMNNILYNKSLSLYVYIYLIQLSHKILHSPGNQPQNGTLPQ